MRLLCPPVGLGVMKVGVTVEAVIALGGITNSPDAPLLLEELGVA